MKKHLFILVFLSITLHIFGQGYNGKSMITKKVIDQTKTLFLSENYKDCIDTCRYYIGYRYNYLGDKSHPYRDYKEIYALLKYDDILDIAEMMYLGCISVYQYTLSTFDVNSIFEAIVWARTAAAIYADYMIEDKPDDWWSAERMYNYINNGERGIVATQCGEHFLKIMDEDSWVKKQNKWFDKTSDRIYDALFENVSGKEFVFSDDPLLQYKISTIRYDQMLKKGNYKVVQENFEKRMDALIKLIQLSGQSNYYSSDIYFALNSLTTMLCTTVTDNEFCKKAGKNYERFCMENLIKLQDISYFLNGSTRYSRYSSYTLRDIQNSLGEKDCAIIHFEAPVTSGSLYYRYDLGTRYRNYALVITKEQEIPELWHRGYINDTVVNDLSKIKETHPDAKRFFCVGTPRMSFIDIAGTDDSIVRLHSLSQLLHEPNRVTIGNGVTFIGDINYSKTGDPYPSKDKGDEFGQLLGAAIELEHIKSLFTDVRSVCCDQAIRTTVTSEICRSKGVVHISTHGALLGSDKVFSDEDLILKKNVMENSRLILSGYNDTPNSPLTYLSGSDVLKLKKIDASIVFLDACSSGQGAVGASGSVGMAEAFHLIGTQNVICYLEPVGDEIATRFSNRFYIELSKGTSCHEAFYTAKKSINNKIKVVLWE